MKIAKLEVFPLCGGTVDGGWRVASPDQTFDRLKHHISPITGIVGDLIDFAFHGLLSDKERRRRPPAAAANGKA